MFDKYDLENDRAGRSCDANNDLQSHDMRAVQEHRERVATSFDHLPKPEPEQ